MGIVLSGLFTEQYMSNFKRPLHKPKTLKQYQNIKQ